jgi:phosphatidylglycerol:prolipoprotein diacylglycerol transferase
VLADSVVPGLGLAIAIMRWVCWTAGCCFGRPSSLLWGVSVEPFGSAHLAQVGSGQAELFGSPLPVHPYPLYELAIGLVVGCVCFFVWRKRRPGATVGVFLALFFLLKLLVTFTRMPDSAGDPPWVHLGIYAGLVV